MTSRDLWVVRHAPVAVRGVCYGQSDVPTELDAATAARVIVEGLEAGGVRAVVERIWTSPWERTRGVAEELGVRLQLAVEVDPRLSELSFGAWEGRSYAELEAVDGERFARWMAAWETASPPGGERVADLVARVTAWRANVAVAGLAVTHAGPIRVLRALDRGVSYASVAMEKVEHLRIEAVGARGA